jgi:hypothetical protein
MRLAFGVVLLGTMACTDSPVAPPPSKPHLPVALPVPPAPQLGTEYVLVLVNLGSLPSKSPIGAGQWDDDGAEVKLVGATLSIYSDGTLLESWEHRSSSDWSVPIMQACRGLYTRISNAVLQVGIGEGATFMTLSATGLVWEIPGFTLAYELLK